MDLRSYIREFRDFPTPGIGFKDISPLLGSPQAMNHIVSEFAQRYAPDSFDVIAGAESRGLIFASSFALHVNKGCVMVRKQGKLPGPTHQISYGLEYGNGVLEMQHDAIKPGQRVLIVDDLLATGGTAKAAADLIERLGGQVVGYAFVIELSFLPGRELLQGYDIHSLVTYDGE